MAEKILLKLEIAIDIRAENYVSGTTRDEQTQIYTDGKGIKIKAEITKLPDGKIQVTKTLIK
jgi:hypothetical protein